MKKKDYKGMMVGVDSETINALIDAYVHNDRDREILKLNLLHGISYMRIADRLNPWVSPRWIQEIMNRWMPVILEHLKR